MILSCRAQWFRLAVAVVLVAGLSACGVKGGLDPPPGAAMPKPKPAAQTDPGKQGKQVKQAVNKSRQTRGADGKAIVVQPQRKDFFLDWLLN